MYDDVVESLIIMSKPHGHADPLIPSVFIAQKHGLGLKKLVVVEGIDVRVRLLPVGGRAGTRAAREARGSARECMCTCVQVGARTYPPPLGMP